MNYQALFDMKSAIKKIERMGFPWQTQDPFLFCVHHRDEFPAGNEFMGVHQQEKVGRNIGSDFTIKDGWRMYHGSEIPGFPYHPHRGFETITINKEGFVDHTDSLGAAGRFGKGDVQWMTAGKGLQHSEMFPLRYQDRPNTMEIFQIWLNLPAKDKLVEPHFKMLWSEDVPVVEQIDGSGKKVIIDIIAGKIGDVVAVDPTPNSWAADKANKVAVLTVKMEPGATWTLDAVDGDINRSLYFYKGSSLDVNGEVSLKEYQLVELDASQEITLRNGNEEASLLILQGKPINEPVAQYGPFVMNTQQEIQEAFAEFRQTQFGGWPWPETEQVHPREKGRFALYADGTEEVR